MVRRFGPLCVGALLSLSLTGCVMTGASEPQPVQGTVVYQPPPHPYQPPMSVVPIVNDTPMEDASPKPPKPPPEPEDVLRVNAPPPPLPVARITRIPSETNEAPVLAALRSLLEKHPSDAAECLQHYDARTREELLALLAVVAQLSRNGLENASPQERAQWLEQLKRLSASLRIRTPLNVQKMCYCRHISGYGLYDPLPDDHPFAGSDRHYGELVQLYVEARNFASRQNGSFYETSLGSKLEIRDARKELVVRMDFPVTKPDRSLSARQDYFLHYEFYVPAKMAPGEYTLTIYLQDDNAPVDEGSWPAVHSLPFRVGTGEPRAAQAANAAPN